MRGLEIYLAIIPCFSIRLLSHEFVVLGHTVMTCTCTQESDRDEYITTLDTHVAPKISMQGPKLKHEN